jgi:hypothetical protein
METVALKPPGWEDLPPAEKHARLLDQALDRKREILSLPLPDAEDDSTEAHRARSLVLAAADSTINQTIALRTNQLSAAADDAHDAAVEAYIEERRQQALAMIAKMDEADDA